MKDHGSDIVIIFLITIIVIMGMGRIASEVNWKLTAQQKIENCEKVWLKYSIDGFWEIICKNQDYKVVDCIRQYTRTIEKKYNNPDIINTKDTNYWEVMESCNKIFGNK